jgi:hypothetical protein
MRLMLGQWLGQRFFWPDFGIFHNPTIASRRCRRYGAFTPYWMIQQFCRHAPYIGGNKPAL